jgi:hypothetical protein
MRMTLEGQMAELADELRQLRAADTGFRVFGSPSHRYVMRPVLSEQALREFEAARGVILPDDYRLFLRTVGDGAAGPSYGLQSLETASKYHTPGEPFPFEQPADSEFVDEVADWRRHRDGSLYVAGDAVGQWQDDGEPGVLEICEHGCAIYSYLVVTGPSRGTMWDGSDSLYPTGETFLAWYRTWVQRSLRNVRNEERAKQLRVGMTTAEVADAVDAAWKERPASQGPVVFYEAPGIPAQLELDEQGRVTRINPWPHL